MRLAMPIAPLQLYLQPLYLRFCDRDNDMLTNGLRRGVVKGGRGMTVVIDPVTRRNSTTREIKELLRRAKAECLRSLNNSAWKCVAKVQCNDLEKRHMR